MSLLAIIFSGIFLLIGIITHDVEWALIGLWCGVMGIYLKDE